MLLIVPQCSMNLIAPEDGTFLSGSSVLERGIPFKVDCEGFGLGRRHR